MVSPHPIGHSGTGPTSIVRRHMPWNTPNCDVKVYSAPLLVFQSDDIVEDPGEPLRVLLLQYRLHSVADDLVHVDSGEACHVVSTVGIVALGRAMHGEFPLRRGDRNE